LHKMLLTDLLEEIIIDIITLLDIDDIININRGSKFLNNLCKS